MLGNKPLVVVIPAPHRKQSTRTSAVAKLLVYEVYAPLRYWCMWRIERRHMSATTCQHSNHTSAAHDANDIRIERPEAASA